MSCIKGPYEPLEQNEYSEECEQQKQKIQISPTPRPTMRVINTHHIYVNHGLSGNDPNRKSLLGSVNVGNTLSKGNGIINNNFSSVNPSIIKRLLLNQEYINTDSSNDFDVDPIISKRSLLNQEYIDTDSSYDLEEYFIYGKDVMDEYTSWYTGDRDGSDFHISDVGGNYLYYTGTLCHAVSDEAPCDLTELPPGEYTWRVTGALNPNRLYVAYDFCGIRGSYSTEIVFEINCDGECVPIRVQHLDSICYGEVDEYYEDAEGASTSSSGISRPQRPTLRPRSLFTLHGSVHIETTPGLKELSDRDRSIIRATLAKEFINAGKGDSSFQEIIEILPTSTSVFVSIPSMSSVARSMLGIHNLKLLSSTDNIVTHIHQIDFKVSLISENYGVDGSHKEEVEALAKDFTTYLHHMMDNGLFTSKLISRARLEGLTSMLNIKAVRLEDLIALDERSTVDERFNKEKSLYIYSGIIFIFLLLLLSTFIVFVKFMRLWKSLQHTNIESSLGSGIKISIIHDAVITVDKEYKVLDN